MGAKGRFVGYLTAAAAGSFVYVAGGVAATENIRAGLAHIDELKIALALWLLVFFMAIIGMFLPWCLVLWVSRRISHSGACYFAGTAAIASLAVGCVISSLLPEPLFVEDQTFLEGIRIAAERQGWLLLLTGIAGGLTYWLVSERRPLSPPPTTSSSP